MQHIQSAIQQVNNGLSASGTAYVGSTGVAYLFWHLSRHVAHGSLQIPRHLILLPAPTDPAKMQSTRLATPVELTQVRRCAAPPRAGDRGDCAPRRVAAGLLAGLLFLFLDMSSFLLHVALALCNAAIEATARHAESRCTFLEGFAGPLSLKCAILAGVGRHEVRRTRSCRCASDPVVAHQILSLRMTNPSA